MIHLTIDREEEEESERQEEEEGQGVTGERRTSFT